MQQNNGQLWPLRAAGLAAVGVVLALAGCQSAVSVEGIAFACGPSQPCASGFECSAGGTCVPLGTPTDAIDPVDADAAPDADAVADANTDVDAHPPTDAASDANTPADADAAAETDAASDATAPSDADALQDGDAPADTATATDTDATPDATAPCIPVDCDDQNPCTSDQCNNGLCSHANLADGSACASGAVCLTPGSCLGGSCKAGQAKLWTKALPGSDYETAKGVALGLDGSYVAVGLRHAFGDLDDALAWHLDAAGNILAIKSFGSPSTQEQAVDVVALADGGYAVLVISRKESGAPADFWLLRLDAKLNTVGESTYGTPAANDVPHALIRLADGFVLVGATGAIDGPSDAFVLRTDLQGVLQWTKIVGVAGVNEFASVVRAAGDGSLLVAGQHKAGSASHDTLIFRLAPPFKQVAWQTVVASPGMDDYAVGAAMIGAELMVATYADGGAAGDGKAGLMLVDPATGAVKWSRLLGSQPIQLASDLTATADGGALLVGMAEKAGKTGMWLLRVGADGWPVWERSHAIGVDCDGNSAMILPDGGALAVGGTYGAINDASDLFLARVDAFGNASCEASGGCLAKTPADCSDGVACTGDDCSAATMCINTPDSSLCDDGNVCTADACKANGCSHTAIADGSACSSGQACTLGDQCLAGQCTVRPPLWSKTLDSAGATASISALATLGEDAIAVGTCASQAGDVCVWRVDPAGKVLWSKTFGTAAVESALDIATLSDGTLGIVGRSAGKTWLLHLDGSGNQLASVVLGLPGTTALAIAAAANGGAVIAGYAEMALGDENGWYARLNSDFSVGFHKNVGTLMAERFVDVAWANNQLWTVGYSTQISGKVLWAVRTDNADSQENFTLEASTAGFTAVRVAPLGGEAVAVGTSSGGAPVYYRLAAGGSTLAKITSSGLGQKLPLAMVAWLPTNAAGGGAAVVAGDLLWRYAETGGIAWQASLSGSAPESKFAAIASSYKALWLGGTQGQSAWLARRDVYGNATCSASGPCFDLPATYCTDGIPCTADTCSAALFQSNCPGGKCEPTSACGHTNLASCQP